MSDRTLIFKNFPSLFRKRDAKLFLQQLGATRIICRIKNRHTKPKLYAIADFFDQEVCYSVISKLHQREISGKLLDIKFYQNFPCSKNKNKPKNTFSKLSCIEEDDIFELYTKLHAFYQSRHKKSQLPRPTVSDESEVETEIIINAKDLQDRHNDNLNKLFEAKSLQNVQNITKINSHECENAVELNEIFDPLPTPSSLEKKSFQFKFFD